MTLKINRAPLLSNIKLCASFHCHMWNQTGVTVRKLLSGVMTSVTLTFGLWPWPLAWTSRLSMVITENFSMIRFLTIAGWYDDRNIVKKGATGGRTDRQTDRWTDGNMCSESWLVPVKKWKQKVIMKTTPPQENTSSYWNGMTGTWG